MRELSPLIFEYIIHDSSQSNIPDTFPDRVLISD